MKTIMHNSYFSTVTMLTICLCLFSSIAYSQSSNRNYILTRTFTTGDGSAYQYQVDYYYGLGRPEQSVLKNAVPNGGHIVTLQEYDYLGRKSSLWNPVAIANNAGQYVLPATIQSNTISMYGDSKPYSKPVYEPSPLSRILEQYAPGADWHNNYRSVKQAICPI